MAHPLTLGIEPAELPAAVEAMAADGVDGVEAIYGRYTPEERRMLTVLARRHGLAVTGGSDYHGTYKADLRVGIGRGDLSVPEDAIDELRDRRPPDAP